ncbi:MAG TPA: hypothetical protein VMH32_20570 [Burkholderiales bacterium]|nr:hypothetical protein [Burkholderiales bacterium]
MRAPVDVASRVSPELSELIEKMANDPDREEPATLGDVSAALKHKADAVHVASLHPQDRTSILVELDELVEEFGAEAPAIDFVAVKASEGLSRVIEAAMDDVSLPEEPTLGRVREAMVSGLTARLVGEGTMDPDEDATLLEEIDELIRHYGEDAVAEDFIRFE